MPKAEIIPCVLKALPKRLQAKAARLAVEYNPNNHPTMLVAAAAMGARPSAAKLTLLIDKRWPPTGVRLGVAFLDGAASDLRARTFARVSCRI